MALERRQSADAAQPQKPQKSQLRRLATLLAAHAPSDGRFDLPGTGVSAIRLSHRTGELLHAVQHPALCIVVQGAKRVLLGQRVFDYGVSNMLVFSVDLPVVGEVLQASPAEPYLCFMLELDRFRIARMLRRVFAAGPPEPTDGEGLYLGQADAGMVVAAADLLELLLVAEPDDALARHCVDEILVGLLHSTVGSRLALLGVADSGLHRVANAITWLRDHFREPVNVEKLAGLVHMSVSSFHQHFKAVTAMSPLQFQKALRLQEARRMMLASEVAAANASRHVGYASPSQFSREFARYFGSPPRAHVEQLRAGGEAAAAAVAASVA